MIIHRDDTIIEINSNAPKETVEAVLIALTSSYLSDITVAENIYIACGYTDMWESIDGLATLVQQQFRLDPFQPFLLCDRCRDCIKCLLWEGDGFVLLYKRLENGSFQWPRDEVECKTISGQQFRWLMKELKTEQKLSISTVKKGDFCWWKMSSKD